MQSDRYFLYFYYLCIEIRPMGFTIVKPNNHHFHFTYQNV